jgi:hypothetical protein
VFYDKDMVPGEKNKNSNTGMMALRLFLDPLRNTGASGLSVLADLAPQVRHLIFTGDTGNGFRGIPMSWFHSTIHHDYGFTCEQIPLAPRHAHNDTDAHFAHLNSFFRKLMRVTFLIGAAVFARALSLATNPNLTNPRKLIKRCTVLYHRFTVSEYITVPDWLIKVREGEISVSKLGYFLFSTTREDGAKGVVFEEGIMRVRRNAPELKSGDDPLLVWDMRHPHQCCQVCSDREVSRTPLCSQPSSPLVHTPML